MFELFVLCLAIPGMRLRSRLMEVAPVDARSGLRRSKRFEESTAQVEASHGPGSDAKPDTIHDSRILDFRSK